MEKHVRYRFLLTVSLNHRSFRALNYDSSQGNKRSTLFENMLIATFIIFAI